MKKITIIFLIGLFFLVNVGASIAEEVIKLPDPQTDGGMPLMKALSLRKSTRGNFGPDKKLSMQQMSNMLWAANGINRPGTNHRTPHPFLQLPTGRISISTLPRLMDTISMMRKPIH